MVINVAMTHDAIISSNKYVSTTNKIVSLPWDINTISLWFSVDYSKPFKHSIILFVDSYLNQPIHVNSFTALFDCC